MFHSYLCFSKYTFSCMTLWPPDYSLAVHFTAHVGRYLHFCFKCCFRGSLGRMAV